MGRSNRERRAAKRRREAERLSRARAGGGAGGGPGSGASRPIVYDPGGGSVDRLVAIGAQHAHAGSPQTAGIVAALVAAGGPAGSPGALASRVLGGQLTAAVAALWEGGWQPLDVAHVARRQCNGRVARLAARIVLEQASVADAYGRAPEAWVAQLRALPAKSEGHPPDAIVGRWQDAEDLDADEAILDALRLLGLLWTRPALGFLLPSPSRWHEPRARSAGPGATTDPKMLARIRALLAKAEATTFPEEADTFTAKAQELVARHAIDHAVLRAAGPGGAASPVVGRRVHVNDPYAEAKVQLLAVVARANAGRAVWDRAHGFATVLAQEADLELIELLFTSLLVQATQAAAVAGRAAGRTRAPSFRRAFLTSYAVRIGDRLDEARQGVEDEAVGQHGTALVPLLAAREDAVDEALRTAFPRLEHREPRRFDAQGWHAGRLAADLAHIGADRPRLPG